MLEFLVSEGPNRGATYAFPSPRFIVGSAPGCPLRLTEGAVEPQHVEIITDPLGQVRVVDLTGKKVEVNGMAVADARLLPGSFIMLGELNLLVREVDARASETASTLIATKHDESSGPTALLPGVAATIGEIEAVKEPDVHATQDEKFKDDAVQVGAVIDNRYRIVKRIAVGGMGEVYRAEHVELRKPMALKVMLKELSGNTEFVGRFRREAIAVSRLGHENIVDISDFGQTADGRFYFVMEFLEGMTLSRHLRKIGPLSVERVCVVGAQIARALAAAHSHSIVHRDLKPDNLMLVQRAGHADFVKVLDFGVAKMTQGTMVGMTVAGVVMGTPQYMSPEQARGHQVDQRSDLYSLGLILYEALTGKPTFVGETPPVVMFKQATEKPPPLPPGLAPPHLEELIYRLLNKRAEDRPQSAEAVAKELERLTAELQVAAATPRATVPPRVPAALATVEEAPRPKRAPVELGSLRSRQLTRAVWGVVVLAALVVPVALASLFWPRGEAPVVAPVVAPVPAPVPEVQAPPTPAAPTTAQLTIKSDPERAEVYEGDVLLGTAPLVLKRPVGAVLELKLLARGFKPVTRKVGFASDSEITVPLEKEKAKLNAPPNPPPRKPTEEDLKAAPF